MKNISPLRWAGGKSWLANDIKKYFDASGKKYFFEPFVGSGSVFLTVGAEKNIIADNNPFLINFWRCLRERNPEDIYKDLPENNEVNYYRIRDLLNQYVCGWKTERDIRVSIHGDLDMARWFYYINKTCFNGLWRTNNRGKMNVPYGKRKNVNFEINVTMPYVDVLYRSYDRSIM
ncbi:MAG: DNA adenine methylase, partial [Waterburya sp.]